MCLEQYLNLFEGPNHGIRKFDPCIRISAGARNPTGIHSDLTGRLPHTRENIYPGGHPIREVEYPMQCKLNPFTHSTGCLAEVVYILLNTIKEELETKILEFIDFWINLGPTMFDMERGVCIEIEFRDPV